PGRAASGSARSRRPGPSRRARRGRCCGPSGHPPLSMNVDTIAQCIDIYQYPPMSMKAKTAACCASLLRTRLGRDDAEELAAAFKAIADRGRLRLLSCSLGQPDAEACVCHLVAPLGLA